MRLVHVCLSGIYTDGFSYQENILSKYHARMGYSVSIIASQLAYNSEGHIVVCSESDYVNADGVHIYRLQTGFLSSISGKLRVFRGFLRLLSVLNPDIVFCHGCQSIDNYRVVHYKRKHENVKVFFDNHADFSNSASTWISRNILHKLLWGECARRALPYVEKFYGVVPARVDFLTDLYCLPRENVDLLVMGADDDKVALSYTTSKENTRRMRGVKGSELVLLAGGKIDNNKSQILLLINAVKSMPENVKLIVFGSVSEDLKNQFFELIESEKIVYIGWINAQQFYNEVYSADLVVFPGKHSVYWEQAVGAGAACLFKYMEGFTHIDMGGNCEYFFSESIEEYQRVIRSIYENKQKLEKMRLIAMKVGTKYFSYRNIAAKSILIS